jgi:glycosyltransferase involved in cell wall biosynthesis
MATCNGGRYLRAQLESILPQLAPEDEVVVSDDSSTDETLAILADYVDARLRVLPGNTWYNPVQNFENALRHARGEILVLSDQDDYWLPGKLDLVRQHLAARVDQVALVMMDGELVDAAGKDLGTSIFKRNRVGTGILKNIYDNTYTGCCLAFSRPLLEIALPFPKRIPMHDMWLGLLAEIFGQVELIPVKTICYRRHGANASQRSASLYLQGQRRFWLVLNLLGRYGAIRWKRWSGSFICQGHE